MTKHKPSSSPPPESYKQSSATPYTPFSPFKSKSRRQQQQQQLPHPPSPQPEYNNLAQSMSTSDSFYTMSSPTMSTIPSNHTLPLSTTTTTTTSSTSIGSKTDIILSPNGHSIQLAPEVPHVLSPKKMLVSDSTTISPIFRRDVRREWINAMFGKDFFADGIDAENNEQDEEIGKDEHEEKSKDLPATHYTPPRQGMGLAGIPSYLSYTATIPPAKEAADAGNKVGMTLSRIPIGVYVRLVDLESEAYAAGVVPGSILIDINGMGVLGEPSHKLLERLWKFEGHFRDFVSRDDDECRENGKGGGGESGHDGSSSGGGNSGNGNGGHDAKEKKKSIAMALKFIKDGVVYSVVLMTGSPLGISWAPCGNFALVQRTYAMAQKAGVRRGCIVAAVNDKNLRDMNHLDTAMYLKDQFDKGLAIRVVCAFTPAASRTGHFDRKNSKTPQRTMNEIRTIDGVRIRKVSMATKRKEMPTEYGVGTFFVCGTGLNYHPNSADTSLSDVDVIMEIANRAAAGEIAAPTGFKSSTSMRRSENAPLSFTTLVSEYMADTNSIQLSPKTELTVKFFPNDVFFPKMSWYDLLPSWDAVESLTFCLRMHSAEYSEEKYQEIGGIIGVGRGKKGSLFSRHESNDLVPLHSPEANTKMINAFGSYHHGDAFHSYLLQILALISSQEIFEKILAEIMLKKSIKIEKMSSNKKNEYMKQLNLEAKEKAEMICDDIVRAIVAAALKNDSLCQSFHFLLRSFISSLVKKKVEDDNIYTPVKTLTSAHCQLRNHLLDADARGVPSISSYETQPLTNSKDSIDGFGSHDSIESDPKKKRGKRFGKLFRRGGKKGNLKEEQIKIEVTEFNEEKDQPGRKNNFVPNSILRKAADQHPHDLVSHGSNEKLLINCPSTATLFENMGWFLSNLDQLCGKIEDALLKSYSQKITEWALQPWSASKDRALSNGTADMRNGLNVINLLGRSRSKENNKNWSPLVNPVNPTESLDYIIPEECYILPSAHFPLLLAFNSSERTNLGPVASKLASQSANEDKLYRTTVKINLMRGNEMSSKSSNEKKAGLTYKVQAAVGGEIKETGKSSLDPYFDSSTHRWHENNTLQFETMSSVGLPGSMEIRLSSVSFDNSGTENITLSDETGTSYYSSEIGFSYVDLSELWKKGSSNTTHQVEVFDYNSQPEFDQQGFLVEDMKTCQQKLTIELQVTTEVISYSRNGGKLNLRKRRLLYKHDEDMRQEMLATQFLDTCDRILKASGLDLKIKKYKCVPVGEKKGFIEWVAGAFALSEICKPMGISASNRGGPRGLAEFGDVENNNTKSAFIRTGNWCQFESLRSYRHGVKSVYNHGIGLSGENPVQDFFRMYGYDANAPYLIKKEVMDNFVKSCAGYSVITYILGVGDRHTDNLLLHPKGYFLHCDYSFILGQDPKTYQPMRITEHMVNGMGGRDSDNFAKFLSLAGAAFVTLRRHPSVRTLLSIVRALIDSEIPDVSMNQSPEIALQSMFERFRLDLNDDEAVTFLEENIERSISSRIWIAVDAIHSLGKRF